MSRPVRNGGSASLDPDADPVAVARNIVLRQLAMGPRTRAQLEQSLLRRGVPGPATTQVLDRFTEVGLIDDVQYAEVFLRSSAAAGGLSRRRAALTLRERGVADEITETAVGSITGEQEWESALQLAQRRASRYRELPPDVARRRLMSVLARRGFSVDIAGRVAREVLEGASGEEV